MFWDTRLQAGEYFDEKIEAELEACACVVVLWTERSVKRRWVRVEAREGAEREILVPVSVHGARPPLEFRGIQTLAMDEASKEVLEALWGAVSRHVAPSSGAESDVVAKHGGEVLNAIEVLQGRSRDDDIEMALQLVGEAVLGGRLAAAAFTLRRTRRGRAGGAVSGLRGVGVR